MTENYTTENQATNNVSITYLACPYTHPDFSVRESRFLAATKAAAHLIAQGRVVYSPITMTHPLDIELAEDNTTLGSDYWVAFDEAFMEFCFEMVILRIPGWSRPVTFLDPDTISTRDKA